MQTIFTGSGSWWTYVIIGLIITGAILLAYFKFKKKDQRPPWLKSSKSKTTSKPRPGYYVVTNMYEDSLELTTPETKEKVVIQNSHYEYTGKRLSECPKIVWELSVPYGHSRYDHKVGNLVLIEEGKDELTIYKSYMYTQSHEPIATTGRLTTQLKF